MIKSHMSIFSQMSHSPSSFPWIITAMIFRMFQVMAAILRDPNDTTQISLLYANQSEEDILVRDMLEELSQKNPDRLKLWFTVDRHSKGWKYSSGFITDQMIADHLPPPSDDTLVLMCGPPPMVKFACIENLDKLGYAKSSQVAF